MLDITTRQRCPVFWDGNTVPAAALISNNLQTQWALSLDERAGGAGWQRWGGVGGGVGFGLVGENRTRGWQCCSECVSFFGVEQGGHRWGTEPRPVRPTLWMQIMLHCTRLPRSSEGAGHLFCGYYECRVCFRVEQNTDVFAYVSTHGPGFALLFWSYRNHGINHAVM